MGRSIHVVTLNYRLVLGAVPAVLVAALIVTEMPMTVLHELRRRHTIRRASNGLANHASGWCADDLDELTT